jgi:hypothetical protein
MMRVISVSRLWADKAGFDSQAARNQLALQWQNKHCA